MHFNIPSLSGRLQILIQYSRSPNKDKKFSISKKYFFDKQNNPQISRWRVEVLLVPFTESETSRYCNTIKFTLKTVINYHNDLKKIDLKMAGFGI